jgi:hypothetical protein
MKILQQSDDYMAIEVSEGIVHYKQLNKTLTGEEYVNFCFRFQETVAELSKEGFHKFIVELDWGVDDSSTQVLYGLTAGQD